MVPNLVAELSLRRLMRLLSDTGFCDAESDEDELDTYGLTLVSVPNTGLVVLSPFHTMLHPVVVSLPMSLASWFRTTGCRDFVMDLIVCGHGQGLT